MTYFVPGSSLLRGFPLRIVASDSTAAQLDIIEGRAVPERLINPGRELLHSSSSFAVALTNGMAKPWPPASS